MEFRQWIIGGAGLLGSVAVGIVLEELGFSIWIWLAVALVCFAIVAWGAWKTGTVPLGWADLESRFAALVERDNAFRGRDAGELRADHELGTNGTWFWRLAGGDSAIRREVQRICELAGAELRRPSKIFRALMPQIKRQGNDLDRWLYFLMDIGEGLNDKSVRINSVGTWSGRQAGDVVTYYPYSIPGLVKASLHGCVECLTRERTDQGGAA